MVRSTNYQTSSVIPEVELHVISKQCLICGNVFENDKDRQRLATIQKQPNVYLLYCTNCHGASASRMPTQVALDRYYKSYYTNSEYKYTFSNPDRLVDHILSHVKLPGNKVRLLDFGGGNGTIGIRIAEALAIGNQEVEIVLVDYEKPLDNLKTGFSFHHYDTLDKVPGKFDLIIASAILEHIPELKKTMESLQMLAGEGSYFYARTPWVAPLMKIYPKLDFTFPAHLHDLGAQFWNSLPETFGWPVHIVKSQPSIIETTLHSNVVRTTCAYLLKLPAYLERKAFPGRKNIAWQLVGGWEVFLKFL